MIGSLLINLLNEINKVISNFNNISFKLIAVNDGSKDKVPKINHYQKI